jgi:hypothetical protein
MHALSRLSGLDCARAGRRLPVLATWRQFSSQFPRVRGRFDAMETSPPTMKGSLSDTPDPDTCQPYAISTHARCEIHIPSCPHRSSPTSALIHRFSLRVSHSVSAPCKPCRPRLPPALILSFALTPRLHFRPPNVVSAPFSGYFGPPHLADEEVSFPSTCTSVISMEWAKSSEY